MRKALIPSLLLFWVSLAANPAREALEASFQAETFYEKERLLNAALEEARRLPEKEALPLLAELYAALNEEAFAKLYRLRSGLEKRPEKKPSPLKLLFAPLPLPKALWAFFLSFLALFFALSASLWKPSWTRFSYPPLALALYFFCSLLYLHYARPLEAVAVEAASLLQAPDPRAPYSSEEILYPGSIVDILGSAKEGKWLKVKNERGIMGYVPQRAVRMI